MKYSGPLIVTLLVGIYIALQLIADITAAKIVMLGSTALPAGTFVFALTFTWRDMLHKKLGKEWAQAAIWTAALANVGMALYFVFAIRLNPAPFWQNQEAFSTILGIVPRITIASIIAELVSELIDTEVYAQLEHRISERHQWLRVLGSNAVSLPVDSIFFNIGAFYGVMSFADVFDIVTGQIFFKALVTMVSLPLIYAVSSKRLIFAASPTRIP